MIIPINPLAPIVDAAGNMTQEMQTWATLVSNPLMPACFMDTGSTDITSTAATIGLDSAVVENQNYSLASNVITVGVGGVYQITYSIPVNDDGSTGGTRTRVFAFVERDTGGGFAVIVQSRGQDYAREASSGEGVNGAFICELTANDNIRLQIDQSGTTDLSTETNEVQLSIMKVG